MEIIEYLSPYFKRSVRSGRHIYIGNEEKNAPIYYEQGDIFVKTARISVRFTRQDYEDVHLLAVTMDETPSRATAIMLNLAMRHIPTIELILKEYNKRNKFDLEHTLEIKKLMKYVNKDNPFIDTSWSAAFREIVGDIKYAAQTIRAIPKQLTEKMIDRETYQWTFDDVDESDFKPQKKKRK